MRKKQTLAQTRVLAGQCPLCGKEAAPWRLCHIHRQLGRMERMLRRGEKFGVIKSEKRIDGRYWSLGDKRDDADASHQWGKWGTAFHLPESDRRGRPKLRGKSVDVERTLEQIIARIGRPCSIEEITAAWGRLRDRRTSPLATDLATIVAAEDRRKAKQAKRARLLPAEPAGASCLGSSVAGGGAS